MSKLHFFLRSTVLCSIVVFVVLTNGCKPDSKEESTSLDAEFSDAESSSPIVEDASKENAGLILEHNPDAYDGFLLGKFQFDIAIDAMVDEPIMDQKGQIIEFKKDYSYRVTKDNSEIERGKFTYDRNDLVLTLEATKGLSSQWKINYMEGRMIWVGTHVYGNNSRQIRLYELK
jgi:hypothetical protein